MLPKRRKSLPDRMFPLNRILRRRLYLLKKRNGRPDRKYLKNRKNLKNRQHMKSRKQPKNGLKQKNRKNR